MAELRGERVVLRPLAPDDASELQEIVARPEVARWWGAQGPDFPLRDEPDAVRFALLVDGEVAGLVQYGEENTPENRHASIDLFLDPRLHNRGLGTDAVTTLARHLQHERGHHRITIDPAADNHAAIRSYEKVGFRPVGLMRSAWRDPEGNWRDGLLMELVTQPR